MSRFCWFQIHIDAHSDDDNPEYVDGMPLFRYPKTEAELTYFMQKNDVFVQVYELFMNIFIHQRTGSINNLTNKINKEKNDVVM